MEVKNKNDIALISFLWAKSGSTRRVVYKFISMVKRECAAMQICVMKKNDSSTHITSNVCTQNALWVYEQTV